jgi:tetratricopeptide (TPR) repeat protein
LNVFSISALLLCSAQVHAGLELGDVTPGKLKSYRHYFQPYLDVRHPRFEDKEFEEKISQEARDIHKWMMDPASWNHVSPDSAEIQSEACWLFLYFDNIGIPGAGEEALKHLDLLTASDSKDSSLWVEFAELAHRLGRQEKAVELIKEVLEIDPERGAKANFNYMLAMDYYELGNFALAYEAMMRQNEIDPTHENTANMILAMNIWISAWGRVPERVQFEFAPDGVTKIPSPLD